MGEPVLASRGGILLPALDAERRETGQPPISPSGKDSTMTTLPFPIDVPLLKLSALLASLLLASFAYTSVAAPVAAAAVFDPSPVLLFVPSDPFRTGTFVVHGEGFTPGGSVYISIDGAHDEDASESFWTVASTGAYGPNGSQDPAQGFARAGEIHELIVVSDVTTYGPNGSQDPARGFHGANTTACGNVQVQAFDADSRTWSNQVQLDHPC